MSVMANSIIGLTLLFCTISILSFASSDEASVDLQDSDKTKIKFLAPPFPENAYIALYFNSSLDLTTKLVVSQARKDGIEESLAKYDGMWSVEVPQSSAIEDDFALVLKSKAKHHAISVQLDRPIRFDSDELVIQYEVKFQEKIDCGGAYIKLLQHTPDLNLKHFNDKTPYTIMFGPDKCGLDNKHHFIFQHENPQTKVFEEKHLKKVTLDLEQYFSDKKTHLYTLVLRKDNTFERFVDQISVQSGSLLADFHPPVNPPVNIDDPADKKPEDWDDREKIIDKSATKPDDWDEEAPEFIKDETATKPSGWLENELDMIPDPDAKPPKDWDREMDGEWEAPKIKNPICVDAPGCGEWTPSLIRNPKYNGKWSPPLVPNPVYKGIWAPKKIPNPKYFEDKDPYRNLAKVSALGLELWSMTDEIAFDNFLIVDSKKAADDFAANTWTIKQKAEKLADPKAQSVVDAIRETYEEKPWLIFVIGLVCTLPILLCCVYFCRSPSRSQYDMHKKTDKDTSADRLMRDNLPKDKNEDADVDESGEEDMVQVSRGSGDDSDSHITNTAGDSTEDGNTPAEESSSKQSVRKRRSRRE